MADVKMLHGHRFARAKASAYPVTSTERFQNVPLQQTAYTRRHPHVLKKHPFHKVRSLKTVISLPERNRGCRKGTRGSFITFQLCDF